MNQAAYFLAIEVLRHLESIAPLVADSFRNLLDLGDDDALEVEIEERLNHAWKLRAFDLGSGDFRLQG